MKLKALLTAIFVAGLAASIAVAAPGPGKGKEKGKAKAGAVAASTTSSTTGGTTTSAESPKPGKGKDKGKGNGKGSDNAAAASCKPNVAMVLKGEFVSASGDSFAMLVKKANKHGRVLAGKQATVSVDAKTKVVRRGRAALSALQPGDSLVVHARACKNADAASVALLARHVVAKPKKTGGDDDGGSTTTGETTTGSTTTGSTTTVGTTTGSTTTGATTTVGTTTSTQ